MIVCGAALLTAVTVANAQGFADPTRPPATADAQAGPQAGMDGEPPVPMLHTIIRREGAKPAAVINGEYVELGGRIGDARVTKITDETVTLKGSGGIETLRLIPGVEKSAVVPEKAKTKSADGKKGDSGVKER